MMPASLHVHAKVRQVRHWVHRQPPAVIEELPVFVGDLVKIIRLVIQHTAVQNDILAARDDVQRVELDGFTAAYRLSSTFLALPAAPGPESLFAKDETPRNLFGNHNGCYR